MDRGILGESGASPAISPRGNLPNLTSWRLTLIAVTVLAGALRITWLDSVPPAINQDEAVHAWEAQCLLKLGCDHSGARWPVFCHAYGIRESHASPFIYLLIPFQWLMGMNVWSTRLPGALLGVAAVPLVYLLVNMWYGKSAAMFSALFLAVSPWHIHLSRLSFEVTICPTILLAGLVALSWAVRRHAAGCRSRRVLAGFLFSGISIGLVLWTYNAYRVFVPLLIGATVALHVRGLIRGVRTRQGRLCVVMFASGFGVGVSPFVYACLNTPQRAWGHAQAEFVLNREKTVWSAMKTGATSYLHQLSPAFLFGEGEPSPIHGVPGSGKLYWICAPLLAAGLMRVVARRRAEQIGMLLIAWIVLAPVPAGMTKLIAGHSLRAATVLPALQILAGLGAAWLLEVSVVKSILLKRSIQAGILVGLSLEVAGFVRVFVQEYPQACAAFFWTELKPVVEEIVRRAPAYDLVLLTSRDCGQNGTLFLYWSRTEPSDYFAAPRNIWEGPRWDALLQMGKFFFVPYDELPNLVAQLPPELSRVRVLVAERPGIPVDGTVLARFAYPRGHPAMVLYDVLVMR